MENMLHDLLQKDFTDPVNLIPLLMVAFVALYFIAIFLDHPPE